MYLSNRGAGVRLVEPFCGEAINRRAERAEGLTVLFQTPRPPYPAPTRYSHCLFNQYFIDT